MLLAQTFGAFVLLGTQLMAAGAATKCSDAQFRSELSKSLLAVFSCPVICKEIDVNSEDRRILNLTADCLPVGLRPELA